MKSPLWQIVLLTCVLYICLNVSVTNAQQRRYGSVRNSIGRRKLHKSEPIPSGAASLAFVFDITGSMYDDLVQVIEGAAKILLTTLARREKPLYNYVLVPFHDPGKKICYTQVMYSAHSLLIHHSVFSASAALNRNPGPGYDILLLNSSTHYRAFYCRVALPNSYNACLPSREAVYHFYDDL